MSDRRSVGRTAGATRAMRSVRSVTTRSNARSSPVRAGSGMDQCSRPEASSAAAAGGQFLVGGVAHRDHHVVRAEDVVDMPRGTRGQRHLVALCRGNRSRVHRRRRVRACRGGRHRTRVVPQRGGELRACGVVRADEHHADRVVHPGRTQRIEGAGRQCHVGPATVGLRTMPRQHTDLLQHPHVMGQQVRGHREQALQLRRRRLPEQQRIDDRQPTRLPERGVHGRPPGQVTPLNRH